MKRQNVVKALLWLLLIGALPAMGEVGAKDGKTVTLEGQVVCSVCWFEEDRKEKPYGGEADLQCAIRCAKKGISQALAVVGETETTLYLLEPGKQKNKTGNWLDYIGKQVKVTGKTRLEGDKHFLRIDSLEVVKPEAGKTAAEKPKE